MSTTKWAAAADFLSFLDGLGNEVTGLRYDLSTAAAVIPLLNPGRFAPAVLVAGTNGKGSVSWWLARALERAGHRVGLYTSPHLLDLRERIRLNGAPIPAADLLAHANRARAAVESPEGRLVRPPTYYEWVTFAAASYFQAVSPDIHVLEVGLGGRLDAVNVADPVLSVITTIGLEHCRILGGTIEAIAREKMGILRPGAPVVVGPQDGWTAALEAELTRGASAVIRAKTVLQAEFPGGGDSGRPGWALGLDGRFQRNNAATVIAAGRTLRALGWRVDEEALAAGLRDGGWPGRMQRLSADPEILVDGAHNPDAMEAVIEELAAREQPPVVVFGAMRDKDFPAMIQRLLPHARTVILTRVPTPRAAGSEEFEPFVRKYALRYVEDPADALAEAVRLSGGTAAVYVLGSLYLAAAMMKFWPEGSRQQP
jgi:dihydrofolate synthase/folylpolyglutamate synthase